MQTVSEQTAVSLTVIKRGSDGSVLTPTTLKYRVDDDTGTAITAWTSLTPESVTLISIPATSNEISDDSRSYEDRIVTVMSDEGLSTQAVEERRYRVKNLSGVL